MKPPRLLAAATLALCAGCNSLDNPLSGLRLFNTGRDARIFNPQTGQYEWPDNATPQPKTRAARISATAAATPAPHDDGRPYDPQKGVFVSPSPTP